MIGDERSVEGPLAEAVRARSVDDEQRIADRVVSEAAKLIRDIRSEAEVGREAEYLDRCVGGRVVVVLDDVLPLVCPQERSRLSKATTDKANDEHQATGRTTEIAVHDHSPPMRGQSDVKSANTKSRNQPNQTVVEPSSLQRIYPNAQCGARQPRSLWYAVSVMDYSGSGGIRPANDR